MAIDADDGDHPPLLDALRMVVPRLLSEDRELLRGGGCPLDRRGRAADDEPVVVDAR